METGGRSILRMKFPRAEVAATLTSTRGVLTVQGLLAGCADTLRFAVRDSIRVGFGRRTASVFDGSTTPDVDDPAPEGASDGRAPRVFRLYSTTPNPARSGCDIAFDLPEEANVRLQVFDVSGRLVKSVVDGHATAGSHVARWDAAGFADGLYFVRLLAGPRQTTLRVVLSH